jgi:hypothetical protein
MNEEFIAKQKKKKIIAALLCICVAEMHGRMGSLDIAPCMSSASSVRQQHQYDRNIQRDVRARC